MSTLELLLREIAIQLRIANTLTNISGYHQERLKAVEEIDSLLKHNKNE